MSFNKMLFSVHADVEGSEKLNIDEDLELCAFYSDGVVSEIDVQNIISNNIDKILNGDMSDIPCSIIIGTESDVDRLVRFINLVYHTDTE